MSILQTRRGKLEEKLRLELKTNPSVESILVYIDEYEKANLATIEKLKREKVLDTKRISGALKQAINAHGPITKILIGSATKRIYGALLINPTKNKQNILTKILNWIR